MISLTDREKEVLHLIAHEHSNIDISKKLHISVNTVSSYRRRLLLKFSCTNSAGLIRKAFEEGILPFKNEG